MPGHQLLDIHLRPSSWAMKLFGYTTKRRSAFWQFAAANHLPDVRVGPKKIMFDQSEVIAWLRCRSTGTTAMDTGG